MKSDIFQNLIIWDWLTISCKYDDPDVWKVILGMEDCEWQLLDHGANGYRQAYFFGSVSIWFDGQPGMGCCVNLSGQGCRSFEEYGTGDYEALFARVLSAPDIFNITRIDIAFDDHTGILDIQQLALDTEDREFVSRFRRELIEKEFKDGRPGLTVYHGSRKSDIMIRIYDKAAERGISDQHWIRLEMQLRNERATAFAREASSGNWIGILFRGVLFNYLRYVDPTSDINPSRWPLKDYWQLLLDDVEGIRLYEKPGVEYNVSQLDHFVFDQAAGALHCAVKLYGADFVVRRVLEKDISENVKYQKILSEFRCRK